MFGVFRVKNHDFTQNNHIFSNFRGGRRVRPPLNPPLIYIYLLVSTHVMLMILYLHVTGAVVVVIVW